MDSLDSLLDELQRMESCLLRFVERTLGANVMC